MEIVLWGYGKMGKTIHSLLEQSEHTVCGIIDVDTSPQQKAELLQKADGIIEFTQPTSAKQNVLEAIAAGVQIVSGTTAWKHELAEVEQAVSRHQGKFMLGSNFSIGVNIMFTLTEQLGKLTQKFGGYSVNMEEIHHLQKLDSPSGTAVSLAEIALQYSNFKDWKEVHAYTEKPTSMEILAKREPEVPGTHVLNYQSEVDTISLGHVAHNRLGFAKGAIAALEWLYQQPSGMYDVRQMYQLD